MFAQKYHNIFDYKLTKAELIKWRYRTEKLNFVNITNKKSKTRLEREKYSKSKLIIAKKAAKLISKIPLVKFIGVTGSLAMMNAKRESDIDFIIITKKGFLWLTRLSVYFELRFMNYDLRIAGQTNEKDKLCLNMWLDESDLIWNKKDRNVYTAHEIAQIVPLINKNNTYEKFLWQNRWILQYWPYAVSIKPYAIENIKHKAYNIKQLIESFAYFIQYQYMKSKITREVITSTRAIFHPNDWGRFVLKKLSS